ncbi:hypothetical protein KY285_024509 [Solanum tuberosum]|nr:hypothetical protein KY285_024509 [Solanum tuberosum]
MESSSKSPSMKNKSLRELKNLVEFNVSFGGVTGPWREEKRVYGPCDSKKRRELWHKLGAIRGLEALPWVWGGIDFNVTRFSDKRSGRDNNTKSMFLNLVSNVGYARRC